MDTKSKIEILRNNMRENNVDAFVVYSADPHMGEYLPNEWKEREWISGFTGSAGLVVITQSQAGLWTDSRYFIQAPIELKGSGIDLFKDGQPETPSHIDWLKQQLPQNAVVAVNALCCPHNEWNKMKSSFNSKNIKLIDNPLLAKTWKEREGKKDSKIIVHPLCYTGKSVNDKIEQIRQKMKSKNAQTHLITTLDNIAWVLNLRGNDVDFNPVFSSYLAIEENKTILFVDKNKCCPEVYKHLAGANIELNEYSDFFSYLEKISDKTIWINPTSNQAIYETIQERNNIIELAEPSHLMKSTKNEVEIEGSRFAHKKDGVALVSFLYWLENNIGKIPMTEVSIAEELYSFRQKQENFKGASFGTISGYKGNGAIVHYSASPDTCKELTNDGILLLDSGAQYLEGTTDITRTIPLGGEISETFKTDYTLVLKGHIGLAMAKFPHGARGCNLDVLARIPLWKADRNYGHGTGHGVGSYLNVHEGPLNIRQDLIDQAILPGMIMSNEPGLYRTDEYGIRLENLMVCKENSSSEFGNFYSFETITLCPFYTNVIKKELLSDEELQWFNNYHQKVWENLSPLVKDSNELKWLENKCQPI